MNTINSNNISGLSRALLALVMGLLLLYFGRPLFVPMSFGLLLAIISYPACKWLERKGWPKSVSASMLILLIVTLFLALLWLLGFELSILLSKKAELMEKLSGYSDVISEWIFRQFGVQVQIQNDLIPQLAENNLSSTINTVLTAATSSIVALILIPLFGILFLTHRVTFVQFLESVAGQNLKARLRTILHECLLSYFQFIKGNVIVYLIVGTLNSIGLLLLGIEHAILFGMIAAVMTIIPYVGIIISAALPISIALITKDSLWYPAGVVMVFTFVQYLEANVIYPRVVGQQLNLSTWAVLVTIIIGTILWGIAGMILFVPFAAILKIFSDHLPELRPLNILLSRRDKADLPKK